MNSGKNNILIRMANIEDVPLLCEVLNEIIQVGGTTAIETPLSVEEFSNYFLSGKNYISCFMAEDKEGLPLGFQSLEYHPELPVDWADIATFARLKSKVRGIGTALFSYSKAHAAEAGIVGINATIRADNSGGIAYYEKMGFRTYATAKDVPLNDGKLVDRVSKKLLLG